MSFMDGPLLLSLLLSKELIWQLLKNFFGGCMYFPRKLIFFVEFTTRGYVIYLTQNFESMNFYCFKMCFGVHVLAKFRGGLMMIFIYRRNFDFCTPKHEV